MVNNKILVSGDLTDEMEAKVLMERLNTEIRDEYNLRGLVRVIDTGQRIHISQPLTTKNVEGHREVKELEEAAITSQEYEHIDKTLHKNVVHIALSDESRLSAEENVWNMHVQDSAREIAKMENTEISEIIDDASEAAPENNNWSTDDPFFDIMEAIRAIREDNLEGDSLLMDPQAYAQFVSNEEIVKRLERGVTAEGTINSIAGLNIYTSNTLQDTEVCYVIDTNAPAAYLADGPRMIKQYEKAEAFYRGYLIGDFLHVDSVWQNYSPEPILKIDTS